MGKATLVGLCRFGKVLRVVQWIVCFCFTWTSSTYQRLPMISPPQGRWDESLSAVLHALRVLDYTPAPSPCDLVVPPTKNGVYFLIELVCGSTMELDSVLAQESVSLQMFRNWVGSPPLGFQSTPMIGYNSACYTGCPWKEYELQSQELLHDLCSLRTSL